MKKSAQMMIKEIKQKTGTVEGPTQEALLVALEQNLLHARYEESQRFWLLIVYLLITLGIVSLISAKGFFTVTAIVALSYLFVLSLSIFMVI
ncbi:MAG: hypothetical protein ACE5KE_14625, partial [Methanosarcinales archaeon]